MSQNDLTLANQSGSAFRADVNSALQALASLSSGASAPSTTYAYQLWADTTNGLLKRRNSANNAWLVLGPLYDDAVNAKSGTYTVAVGDGFKEIPADASGGAFTLTLPPVASAGKGWEITVIKVDNSANAVTLDGDGSEVFRLPGGAAVTTFTLSEQFMSAKIWCDGTQWRVRRIGSSAGYGVGTSSGQLITAQNALQIGKHTIAVGASGMIPATTAGCAPLVQAETTTNKINYQYLAFDPTSIEYAHFSIPAPKSYDASTLQFIVDWAHPSTTTNFGVRWGLEILSLDDNEALDTALGTLIGVTDTGGTTGRMYSSAISSAVTPSNTPSKEDRLFCRISRQATDGADTMAVDAHLIGLRILYGVDAANDA